MKEKFPKANIDEKYTIWEVFSQLDEKFIFIFDEWDYIFNANIFEEDQDKFLEFLKKEYEDLYTCPYCSTRTMTIDYKCARCFNTFSDRHFFQYVTCGYCGEDMVICDAANIEYNNNYIRGLCLNCGNDTMVYKCSKCGQYVNAELFDMTKCHEGFYAF